MVNGLKEKIVGKEKSFTTIGSQEKKLVILVNCQKAIETNQRKVVEVVARNH